MSCCYHFINSTGESVTLQNAKFSPIIMGGDHLTAKRGRGAIRTRMNSDTPVKRLLGLIPISEDCHAKLNMFRVNCLTFYGLIIIKCGASIRYNLQSYTVTNPSAPF